MQYKIIVDKQSRTNPSSEKKEYVIDIEELRVKGDVYDSLFITPDEDYVIRRLSLSEYNVLSILPKPIKQPIPDINIELFEGDNYIYLVDMTGNKFYAEYLIKNDFNNTFATRGEMNSAINQTAQSIELSVNQKFEGYSTTEEMNAAINVKANEINSSVNSKLEDYSTTTEMNSAITQKANEITSEVSETYATKETTNSLSSRIKQTAKSIELTTTDKSTSAGIVIRLKNEDGSQIDAKSANITMKGLVSFTDLSSSGSTTINGSNITTGTIDASKVTVKNINASNITSGTITGRTISGGTITGTKITNGSNFSVDASGNMTCKNAKVDGGTIKLTGGTIDNPTFKIEDNNYESIVSSSFMRISSKKNDGCEINFGLTEIPVFSINGKNTYLYIYDNLDELRLSFKNAYLSGVWHAEDFLHDSLEEKKKNISIFKGEALNIIKRSDIYNYHFKTDKDNSKKHIGLIIGKNYNTPKEIISNTNDGIDLYSMTSLAWKAIQEQQKEIESLKEKIAVLEVQKNG